MTMPTFLASARISAAQISADIPPQAYIDGDMIPFGVCTLLATAGGSGKTTSGATAAVSAAASGLFRFFGQRQHNDALRCVMVLGEETPDMISRKLAHEIPDGIEHYKAADKAGRIAIVSWLDYAMKQATPEKLFDDKGALSQSGKELWASLKLWKPDFIMFDTLSSLSDADYLHDRCAYTTMRELNHLAAATGAAVIMTAHIVKGGASKVDASSSADDLISLSRGSAAIINAARHAIVLVPSPSGAFAGIELAEGEEVWLAGVKSNVGFSRANKTFPVVRSSALRTFKSVAASGASIAEDAAAADKEMLTKLRWMLPLLIRASSEAYRPLVRKPSSSISIEKLAAGPLASLFPPGVTPDQITRALAGLSRDGKILECTATRSGAGEVWDFPQGYYTDEARYELLSGEKIRIFKGACDAGMLSQRIDELSLVETVDAEDRWDELAVRNAKQPAAAAEQEAV